MKLGLPGEWSNEGGEYRSNRGPLVVHGVMTLYQPLGGPRKPNKQVQCIIWFDRSTRIWPSPGAICSSMCEKKCHSEMRSTELFIKGLALEI